MKTVRIKAGTITLPEAVLKTLGLGEGDAVEIVTSETGVVELRRPGGGFKDLRGIIKLERAVVVTNSIMARDARICAAQEDDDERLDTNMSDALARKRIHHRAEGARQAA